MDAKNPLPPELEALVTRLVDARVDQRLAGVEAQLKALQGAVAAGGGGQEDRVTLIVFSGEMDTLFAAFTIAVGAASMGMQVSMFFTFWGLTALRQSVSFADKTLGEKMVALMMPKGPASVPTSRMNMAGMGPVFFKHLMGQRKVESLPSLIAVAREMEVRMVACETSMKVMGVTREELIGGVTLGGVATFLEDAARSKVSLFI